MNRVFLGGTTNSNWRDELIPMLKVDYFNPIVPSWTYAAQVEEERQKKICRYHLYVITPKLSGLFSIAELIDSSNKIPTNTIFCFLESDEGSEFTEHQMHSLAAVSRLAVKNGARYLPDLSTVAKWLNTKSMGAYT